MDLDALLKSNPVLVLAIAILGITLIIYRSIPAINSLVEAALSKRGWTKGSQATTEVDPIKELLESQKALVITFQLFIETSSQRDARIGNLADVVSEGQRAAQKSIEILTRLTESIAQFALTNNNQTAQIAQQSLKFTELIGTIGADRQIGEDTRAEIDKAVKTVEEQNKRLDDLKTKLDQLEKDLREEFLPNLQVIREQIGMLATKAELTDIGLISAKVQTIEAEIRALILQLTIPAAPKIDTSTPSASEPKPNEAPPALGSIPKVPDTLEESKPNDQPTSSQIVQS